MIKSVCLLGSAAGRNAGDNALISGIIEGIDQILDRKLEYYIPTLFPEFIRKTYSAHNAIPVNIMPWTGSIKLFGLPARKAVLNSDLSLVFDAVLFDRALFNPMFNFLSSLYLLLPVAKKAGKKVGLYNCGVGPIQTKLGVKMLKKVCDVCDFITVRDAGSADILREIGVAEERFLITADAALNAPAVSDAEVGKILSEIGVVPEKEILAVNINKYINTWSAQSSSQITEDQFLNIIAEAVSQVAEENSNLQLLLLSTYHGDIGLTKNLASRLSVSCPLSFMNNKDYDHYQIKGVLSRVSLLFAMRLHAMILASSAGSPVAGLAYQPKCNYYFEELGSPESCIDFTDFNSERISAFIGEQWSKRHHLKSHLANIMPDLKKKALIAADCVARLDG